MAKEIGISFNSQGDFIIFEYGNGLWLIMNESLILNKNLQIWAFINKF